MRKPMPFVLLILILLSILPAISVSAVGDQYRRWLDDGKMYSCTDIGGGVIEVDISNQDVEFNSLPTNAQFTINYIDNGVTTTNGPFTVEQTSGTRAYGSFAENFSAYPLTFEFRLDTLIGGVVVYQSSIVIHCSGDTASPTPASIVNVDTGPAPDQYRRWLDDGKVFTCTDIGGGVIQVGLSNQDVEFNNLPADAQFTINYIDNGVITTNGPFTVEQTSGTRAYGSFAENFSAYPLTFEFRLDTLINGVVVYQSSIGISCSADSSGAVTIINTPYSAGGSGAGASAGCSTPIPAGSVQGRILSTINALFAPRADTTTNVVLPAGSSWWVIGAQDGFYEVWISCQGSPVWVPADTLGPNYDPAWGGAPLPDAGA